MASDATSDNPAITTGSAEAKRHVHGPRHLAAILPAVLRPAYKRRSPTTTQLLLDWEMIVGPALARATVPRKLFSGTLVIVCAGPMALELQHLADVVMSRINTHLGGPRSPGCGLSRIWRPRPPCPGRRRAWRWRRPNRRSPPCRGVIYATRWSVSGAWS